MQNKTLYKPNALSVKEVYNQLYISHDNLADLLGIQSRTLADIRRSGELYYSEITAKHFVYKWDDVLEFLESKRIKKSQID